MSLEILSHGGNAISPHGESCSNKSMTSTNSFETLSSHSTPSPRLSQYYLERIRNNNSSGTVVTTDALENRLSRDCPVDRRDLVSNRRAENCRTEHAPWDETDSGLASIYNHLSLSSLSTKVDQWHPSSSFNQRSNNIGEQKDYSRVHHNNGIKERVEHFEDKKFKKHSFSKSSPLSTSSSSTVFLDVRSSVSSPGKVSLRDRLHRRLRQRRLGHNYAKGSKEQQRKENQQESVFCSGYRLGGEEKKEYYGMANRNCSIADWIDDDQTCSSSSVSCDSSLLRFTHHVRNRQRVNVVPPELLNHVKINVYDLLQSEAILRLPWGCNFPIGKCFGLMNSGLHMIGTGAYHVGVEVNGIEYAYGANDTPKLSGVFTCPTRCSPGYEYRSTLDFGKRKTVRREWISVPSKNFRKESKKSKEIPNVYREVETFVDGATVIQKMAQEYMGNEYDLLRQNCCTFAKDACLRLGVTEEDIPTWFLSMAEAGVVTEDAVVALGENVVTPMKRILSGNDLSGQNKENIDLQSELTDNDSGENKGFEVIVLKRFNNINKYEDIKIVKIVEALVGGIPGQEDNRRCGKNDYDECKTTDNMMGLRQTLSWTY